LRWQGTKSFDEVPGDGVGTLGILMGKAAEGVAEDDVFLESSQRQPEGVSGTVVALATSLRGMGDGWRKKCGRRNYGGD
jgi:hypothetical protein